MHDKHGREIEEGDVVVAPHWANGGKPTPMQIIGCNPGALSCNITTICFDPRIPAGAYNAHDVTLAIKKNGEVIPPFVEEDKAEEQPVTEAGDGN